MIASVHDAIPPFRVVDSCEASSGRLCKLNDQQTDELDCSSLAQLASIVFLFQHKDTMATDERNFRSYYYEKVGFRGVEEKKSLEILLKDKPLDVIKLKQFCLRFPVPALHRNKVWKILLGTPLDTFMRVDCMCNWKHWK